MGFHIDILTLFIHRIGWFLYSYPQVYPHKNLTDDISRQSRSGAKWRIVGDRALFIEGVVITAQTTYLQTTYTIYPNICQTTISRT